MGICEKDGRCMRPAGPDDVICVEHRAELKAKNIALNGQVCTPEQLMIDALFDVESESIRVWATSERNGPVFLQHAAYLLAKYGDSCETVNRLTIGILSNAIGL